MANLIGCRGGSLAALLRILLLAAQLLPLRCELEAHLGVTRYEAAVAATAPAFGSEDAVGILAERQVMEEVEAMDMRLLQTRLEKAKVPVWGAPGMDMEAAMAFGDALSVPMLPDFWPEEDAATVLHRAVNSTPLPPPKPENITWWVSPLAREKTTCNGGARNLLLNCREQVAGVVVVSVLVAVVAHVFLWLTGADKHTREAIQDRATVASPQEIAQHRGWAPTDISAAAISWQRTAASAGGSDWLAHPVPLLLLVQLAHWTCFGMLAVSAADMVLKEQCLSMGLAGASCAASGKAQEAATSSMTWLSMVLALPALLAMPLLGHLSDVVGRRPVLLLATLQGVVFYSLFALRGAGDAATLSALAALSCLGNAFVADAAACGALSDLAVGFDEVSRVRLFGFFQTPMWLGQLLGPVLGNAMGTAIGPQRSFLVPAIINGILLPLIFVFVPETLPLRGKMVFDSFDWRKAQPFGVLRLIRDHQRSAIVVSGLAFAELATATGLALWPHFLQARFGWNESTTGALTAAFSAANVLALVFLLPRAAIVSGPRRILCTSAVLSGLLWLMHVVAASPWQMYVVAPIGALTGTLLPPIRAILTHDLGSKSYGLAVGVPLLIQQLAHLAAGPLAQSLWRWVQVSQQPAGAAFFLPIVASVAASVVFCLLPPKALASVLREGLEAETPSNN